MKIYSLIVAGLLTTGLVPLSAQVPTSLDLDQSIKLALKQNPAILKAQEELRRTRGLIVEIRADALPHLDASGNYNRIDRDFIDTLPGTTLRKNQEQPWSATVELSQLIYSGGRVHAAIRAARLTDQIAVLDFDRTVADTLLNVRNTFYQILLNAELVIVREQSVTLLEHQLDDAKNRFAAGTVPQFNVLRAEVELANAKPPLIRARNDLRLSKEALAKLLALDTPVKPHDFTAINFVGKLTYEPRSWTLADALDNALAKRPELQQAEKQVGLQTEQIKVATAGYKPSLSVFGDYGVRNSTFSDHLDQTIHGWTVGAQATWPLFDGLLTQGKVQQARAQLAEAEIDLADTRRSIELEVRQAYSDYLQALELIEAQKKTIEQAEESLRLAEARFRAGTGTQLDVLSAQTALTDARSNEVQALHDYNVALATLDRATGTTVRNAD